MTAVSLERVIEDPVLQRFAESDAKDALSVIIEARTAPLRVSKVRSPSGSRRDFETYSLSSSSNRTAEARRALEAIRDRLETLKLGQPPVVLEGAHSVVASVTPDQLRRLATMPEIAVIRRNQSHSAMR